MTTHAIGIIGTGAMGTPMALRLLGANNSVFYLKRRTNEVLENAGAQPVNSAAELASKVSAVLVMLPDLPYLEPHLEGDNSLLAGGKELLIMVGSTSSPVRLREIAQQVRDKTHGRVTMVDCPVSGGVEGASAGTLSIMMGGTSEEHQTVEALLSPCGTVHHLGPLGAGEVAKSCNQMVVGATMLALAEATVLGERSGIDAQKLLEVLGGGYAGSTLLESKKRHLVENDFTPGGIAKYMLKDLGFAQDVSTSTGSAPALLPNLAHAYEEVVEAGYGDEDLAVVKKFIENRN